ncbi:MAG TPA: TonB-dependent receptor [Aquaticitalea sp.]|nr:TonB-dependent receptor [Aquaticitalea sp.]
MRKPLFFIALLWISFSFSQTKFEISGILKAEQDSVPLESATVFLETLTDSTLVTYTISDKEGRFKLEDRSYDKTLRLVVSLVGFETYTKKITLKEGKTALGTIFMPTANLLDEVVIKSRSPVTIKKDTLEFNVASFKTKKDANVEDLLKELPGVEVDEDGKIKVNGKEVSKILVNGKPFFGNDPTIATRNLTKEIIEKIQIVDTKTKSEVFTGEKGDSENKTINLTIKEENNKGIFGRLSAGGGTDERYELAGMFNKFDNDRRISVLAGKNNTNSPGFSFGEIQKMFSNIRSMSMSSTGAFSIDGRSFGGGQGITTSQNIGANYADVLAKGIDVTADYFMSASNSVNETMTNRENILPDSRYFTYSNSRSENDTENHSANMEFEVKVDSTFLITVAPNFRFAKSKNTYRNDEQSYNDNNVLTNQSTASSYVETFSKNFANELDLTKRFGSRGAFVKLAINTEVNLSDTDDFLNSETTIFGDDPSDLVRDQYADGKQSLESFGATLTYRLPLVQNKLSLDFMYGINSENRESIKSTFDFNETSQQYDVFNMQLSTNFDFTDKSNKPSLSLSYNTEKMSANISTGYVFRTLGNKDHLRPQLSLERDFEALEIGGHFSYRFSPKASIYSGYNLSNQPPQISQLQPFQDVSDPLNTITGNPNLEPSNNHGIYVSYNGFDFQKGTGFNVYFNSDFTNNQVVSKTTVDENFVRSTTYENVNGNYRMYLGGNYSKSIKLDTLNTLKYRVGLWGNTSRNINYNNEVKYASITTSLTPNGSITFNWNKVLEIVPNYRLSISKNSFDLEDFDDNEFVRHSFGLRTATFVPKKLEWRNDINYVYNPNVAPGFQKSSWFWNSTLAYSIMKDQATLTLKAYDLLNQNTNAQRTSTQNYIQDSQSTVLQQYFMLSFSWKFNSLGKNGEIGQGSIRFID